MSGMNAITGRRLDGIEHIRQSVRDILTTPIGSRVMRRDYGSLLPDLIDQPLTDATLLRAYAASVMAITRWEPRVRVLSIRRQIRSDRMGSATLEVSALTRDGESVSIEVPTA